MHPNPVFHTQSDTRNLAYARERAFGVLAVNGDAGPWMSHVPFLLNEEGTRAALHLLRSNPIARALKSASLGARLAVSGPDAYVSPDWYGIDDQVPTWNYIAVHLTGTLSLLPDADLQSVLDRQTALFEDRLLPKTPWKTKKMSEGVMDRMMRSILPCLLEVTGVDGTWKLNQNKPDAVRLQAADHVARAGLGQETEALAAMMRGADGQDTPG
jgi:transcriptional regulator